jgi:hypothetical protein
MPPPASAFAAATAPTDPPLGAPGRERDHSVAPGDESRHIPAPVALGEAAQPLATAGVVRAAVPLQARGTSTESPAAEPRGTRLGRAVRSLKDLFGATTEPAASQTTSDEPTAGGNSGRRPPTPILPRESLFRDPQSLVPAFQAGPLVAARLSPGPLSAARHPSLDASRLAPVGGGVSGAVLQSLHGNEEASSLVSAALLASERALNPARSRLPVASSLAPSAAQHALAADAPWSGSALQWGRTPDAARSAPHRAPADARHISERIAAIDGDDPSHPRPSAADDGRALGVFSGAGDAPPPALAADHGTRPGEPSTHHDDVDPGADAQRLAADLGLGGAHDEPDVSQTIEFPPPPGETAAAHTPGDVATPSPLATDGSHTPHGQDRPSPADSDAVYERILDRLRHDLLAERERLGALIPELPE